MASQCRRVKVKLEGSPLGRAKQGYSAPVYAEAPDLFPRCNSRPYSRKEFHEKYGLSCSGINPKHLKQPEDYMEEDLLAYLGPVVNKNGHRYMFLRNEEVVKKLELLWMQIHQKHCLLSSRLISLGMARGFYCQEKLSLTLNWAAYAKWTNSEQLRRRQKSMKQGKAAADSSFSDDEECDVLAEDGGSSGSKNLSLLDSLSRQESVSGNRVGYEGFGGPSALAAAIEAWKTYRGILSKEHERMVKSLTLERKAKDDFTVADARSKRQMEFCLEKLSNALGRLESLEASRDSELQRISESDLEVCRNSLLDSLAQDIKCQKKVVACCETWASDGQIKYLKVQDSEFGVAARVMCLEDSIVQLDRHELAVKSCISRLETGSTLFRFHFQESTTYIEVKCKREMHGDWWAVHGIVKPGTKVLQAAPSKKRPDTVHEVLRSPNFIQIEEDEVGEGVILTPQSTKVPVDWTLRSTVDVPSSSEVLDSSKPSPLRTPKSTGIGGKFTSPSRTPKSTGNGGKFTSPSGTPKSMGSGAELSSQVPSLCQAELKKNCESTLRSTVDRLEGSPASLETEGVLQGLHMRGKGKGSSPGSGSHAAVTRVEPEFVVYPGGQETEEEHNEDTAVFEGEPGDEASESDGKEGEEEHAEDSAEDEATVDEPAKKKIKKRAKIGTKRKSTSNQKSAGTVGLVKRKKVPVGARMSTASNTRAAAKVSK